jgi:hypothetical protein
MVSAIDMIDQALTPFTSVAGSGLLVEIFSPSAANHKRSKKSPSIFQSAFFRRIFGKKAE